MAWYNPKTWFAPKKKNYDALNPNITNDGWNPGTSTPTADFWEIMRLGDRVDWLLKNDPMTEKIISTYRSYVVGGEGIAFQAISKTGNTELVQVVEDANANFFDTTECDAQLSLTYSGIQGTAMREIAKKGGCFIRRRNRPMSLGLTVPMQLQLLTYDYLAQDYTDAGRSNPIVQGVEYNKRWQPVAYYFYENNPKENYSYYQGYFDSSKVIRVSAKNICHLYKKDHGDQKLGVSWLAPVIPTLRMMANYRLNVLTKQQIQSGLTGILVTDDTGGDVNNLVGKVNDTKDGSIIKRGQINRLNHGESLEFPDMPDISSDSVFYENFERTVAAGSGLSYEAVSTNLSQVNYSSARIGWTDMYRNITDWQENIFIAQMNNKVGQWFLEALALQGTINAAQVSDIMMKSIKPKRIMLDPVRETNALMSQIEMGYLSLPEAIESDGRDYLKVQKQRAYDKQIQTDLGIIGQEQTETIEDEDDDE